MIHEGFVHLWQEEKSNWQLVWTCLRNGSIRCQVDPRSKSNVILEVEITGGLRIAEAARRRANSFQIRDAAGKTIMAAPTRDDMAEWIMQIKKHKMHLRRWERNDLCMFKCFE